MDHHSRWDDWSESFAASVRTVNVASADAGPAACLAEDYNILQRVVLGDSGNVANIDPVIVEIDSFQDGRHQVRRAWIGSAECRTLGLYSRSQPRTNTVL